MNPVIVVKKNFDDVGWAIVEVIPVNGDCTDTLLDLAEKIEQDQTQEDIEIRIEIQFLS